MQDGGCGMIDGLKAKTMSQAMLEGAAKTRLLHDITRRPIYSTRAGTIADLLQSGILRRDTGLMRPAPLVADAAREEGARQFGPVAINADLHLNRYRVPLIDSGIGGQVEGAIGQGRARACHDMHMGCHMTSARSRISCP